MMRGDTPADMEFIRRSQIVMHKAAHILALRVHGSEDFIGQIGLRIMPGDGGIGCHEGQSNVLWPPLEGCE